MSQAATQTKQETTPTTSSGSGAAAAPSGCSVQLKGTSYSEGLAALAPRVQMKGGDGGSNVHALAAYGTQGGGGALPYLDTIQASFGRHDVSGTSAHVGGQAEAATKGMGAEAYASGDAVAFGKAPDLHTAAHEAAHIVQQRSGVSLKGGVGQAGDPYEQHADAVADLVVKGQRAEALLDQHTGGGGGGGAAPANTQKKIQRRSVVQRSETDSDSGGGAGGSMCLDNGTKSQVEGEEAFWNTTGMNVGRTLLELTRNIPIFGAVSGIGADLVEAAQYYETLEGVPDEATAVDEMIAARTALVVLNNLVSHVGGAVEKLQDIGVGSVVGAEIAVATGPLNEVLTVGHMVGVGIQGVLDTAIAVTAEMDAEKMACVSSADKLREIENAFWWNVGADVVALLMDCINVASLGGANGQTINQASEGVAETAEHVADAKPMFEAYMSGMSAAWGEFFETCMKHPDDVGWDVVVDVGKWIVSFLATNASIHGPGIEDLSDDIGHVQGKDMVQRSEGEGGGGEGWSTDELIASGAGLVLTTVDAVRGAKDAGGAGVDFVVESGREMMAMAEEAMTELLDGQDPFVYFRDAAVQGLDDMSSSIGAMANARAMCTDAGGMLSEAAGQVQEMLGWMDQVQIPEIPEMEETELGDNALADAAEWVIDSGKDMAADGAEWIREQLQEIVDAAKAEVAEMAAEIQADIDYWTEWFARMGDALDARILEVQALVDEFSGKLAECQNVEDIFNLMLGTLTEAIGGITLTVDDLAAMWDEVVATFDEGLAWVESTVAPYSGGQSG